ncbi:hypothetical protein ACQU0X_32750 [Pseudovibrio ascidiaceicola]|uniref:hypothetical protein n=1 Tax=Pseudovibrio ascidiaceicola TaxID=285279 RepID=UPI003D365527
MSSVGFSASQPVLNAGWDNTADCIRTTLKSQLGSWPMRRDWGASIASIIDKPQIKQEIADFYYAVAEALHPRVVRGVWYGEPRFHLEQILVDASSPGVLQTTLSGIYFPNGHLSSFKRAERKTLAELMPV